MLATIPTTMDTRSKSRCTLAVEFQSLEEPRRCGCAMWGYITIDIDVQQNVASINERRAAGDGLGGERERREKAKEREREKRDAGISRVDSKRLVTYGFDPSAPSSSVPPRRLPCTALLFPSICEFPTLSLSCLVGSFPPLYRHCCRRVHIQGEVVDPYVVLALFGAPGDTKRERTRVVDDNGLSPVWQQSFEFPVHVRFFLLSPCVYRSVHPSFLNSMY